MYMLQWRLSKSLMVIQIPTKQNTLNAQQINKEN